MCFSVYCLFNFVFNPNNAGLFEGSFTWSGMAGVEGRGGLKYIESEKMLTSSVISWHH